MGFSKGIKRLGVFSALSATLVLASACSGISQADLDAAKAQATAAEQKTAAVQKDLAARQQEITTIQQKLTAEQKKAEDALKSAGPAGVTVLIGAKKVPQPPPPPTPTPLPPGVAAPPRPVTPASYSQPVGPYYFHVEALATQRPSQFDIASTVNCLPTSVFKRGQRIVWRFEAIDLATDKRVTDLDGATVKMRLPHGEEITARWSQRAGGRVPDAPWMWNAFWDIPLNYPLGGLDYSITVTSKDGKTTGTWKQPALVSATADSRLQIVE
ncbi:MAG: hypothetical protein Q7T26_04290 [Dehalococcoidia bacterium]|nr:hypothetical protein [Dehalococcoidia bacterium]